jgi:uncharacterized SAM-binding protein YcdF (DUF218 family)
MVKKILKYIVIFFAVWMLIHAAVVIVDGLTDEIAPADVILIFGNKVRTDGTPSKELQSRLDEGVELYNQGIAPLVIVSGGLGKEGYQEAEVMEKYLVAKGIPENNIVEDGDGNNSYLTAKNLKSIANDRGIKKVIIVSQYYHILRAKLALSKFGFATVYSAHAKKWPGLRDLYSIPREIAGYYVYLFKNYN